MTCKDCPPDSKRPTPFPGPRCATHHRLRKAIVRQAAHSRRLAQVYSISREFYDAILAFQGGTCAICQRATGARKRLAVDHDHAQAKLDGHDPDKGCMTCVRGLLCGSCNKIIGHLRDDPEAFLRAANYLRFWPSRSV